MAGLYPDVPAPQIMYDRDGSAGAYVPTGGGTPTAFSAAELAAMNDWSTGTVNFGPTGHNWAIVIFPVLMDLAGVFFSMATNNLGPSSAGIQWSTNTTNGWDGTWTTPTVTNGPGGSWWFGNGGSGITGHPYTRTNIGTMTVTGAKALRSGGGNWTSGDGRLGIFHIYGRPSAGAATDRLRVWHPTLDQEVAGSYFDFGDAGRGGTFDRQFRIRNNSTSLTSNGVVLSLEALNPDANPTVVSMTTFSQGGAFAATQNIGNLAPGETSGICTMRMASPSNAALGLWRQRLLAIATSWT